MNNNSNVTELYGINTVEREFLDPCGYVLPSLNSQEKGIAWDGYMTYYKGGIQDTKHHGGKCFVQVKGHQVRADELNKDIISYKVEMDMMKLYQEHGGVLYFVVYASYDDPDDVRVKAYYYKLLPWDIARIIENKGNQKSVSIKLKAVPKSRGMKTRIVRSFIADSDKQSKSFKDKIPTYKELALEADKWNLEIYSSIEGMFDDPVYVYRSLKELPNYKQAIMKIQVESMSRIMDGVEIVLDNTVWYKDCKHIIEKGVQKIKFGQCLEFMSREDNTAEIKYIPKGKIDEIIKDAEFINSMLSAKVFKIGGYKSDLVDVRYDGIDETLEFTSKIKRLFKKLHVDKEIDLTDCNERMYNDFMTLYDGIVKRKPVVYDLSDKRIIRSLNIYGAHIPVVFVCGDNGELRVYDMFDISKGKFTLEWKMKEYAGMRTTVYTLLYKETFMGLGKRNCNNLRKCVADVEFNKLHGDRLVDMLLEMIKAYYETEDEELYKVTKYVANYLLKNMSNDLNMINYYLACAIKDDLSIKATKKLEKRLDLISEDKDKESNKYAMCLCILLNKVEDFRSRFKLMNEGERNEFKEMPIMKLIDFRNRKHRHRE